MEAQKVTLLLQVECLSVDAINGLVAEAMRKISGEFESGSLRASDGDKVSWAIEKKNVKF